MYSRPNAHPSNNAGVVTLGANGQVSGSPGTLGLITNTRFPTGDSGSSRQLQVSMKLQF